MGGPYCYARRQSSITLHLLMVTVVLLARQAATQNSIGDLGRDTWLSYLSPPTNVSSSMDSLEHSDVCCDEIEYAFCCSITVCGHKLIFISKAN